MNRLILGILAIVVLAGVGYSYLGSKQAPESTTDDMAMATSTSMTATSTMVKVTPGSYTVDTEASIVNWVGKKPLLDGYMDSGTIKLKEGAITAGDATASGSFTIDMNTLHVGLTAKKPGKEGALEEHLKKGDFFDVTKYPTAKFTITKVEPMADSDTTLTYTVTGDLMMKGKTNSVTFPAQIYLKDGMLHTNATTKIDRTKWGISFGSKSIVGSVADKMIDDMVELSFHVVAKPAAAKVEAQ